MPSKFAAGEFLRWQKSPSRPVRLQHGADDFDLLFVALKAMVIKMIIRAFEEKDLPSMIKIWNEIVEDGVAFPQEELLDGATGAEFFASQTYTAVAENETNHDICGLYILHPNNIGRCGHICNASYAVRSDCRGQHIGEKLVLDCLYQAKKHGFKIMQFNAVVENNIHARHLYEHLGFIQLGTIPNGFKMKDEHFENICPYYKEL